MPPLSDINFAFGDNGGGGGLDVKGDPSAPLGGTGQPILVQNAPAGAGVIAITTIAESGANFTLTSGSASDAGITYYGFFNFTIPPISAGAITPSSLNGSSITYFVTSTDGITSNFIVQLTGTLAQSFFSSVTVNGITLLSSAASFLALGGQSGWEWNSAPFLATGTFGVNFA